MEKLLTNYFWIFNIVALTLVAFFLAQGTGEIAATSIEKMLPQKKDEVKKKVRPKRSMRDKSGPPPMGDTILSRNIFDSATGPIERTTGEDDLIEGDEGETIIDPNGLPIIPCSDKSIKLIATVASREVTDWSFATVNVGGATLSYRMGDELNSRTVSGITWRYMFLRGSSDECYIDMFGSGDQKIPPKKPTPRKPAAAAGAGDDRIQKLSDTEAIVDRSLVNELLSDPTKFVRSVRVRPHREGGKIVGYKLRRFRADSPLAKLGAKRGDIIRSVNGVDLTSVDKALGAYQSMRNASDLTFSVTRRGKPVDIKVSIR